MINTMIINCC